MVKRVVSNLYAAVPIVAYVCFGMAPMAKAGDSLKLDFDQKVLEVIKNNPEAILDSLSRYRETQEKDQEARRKDLANAVRLNPGLYLKGSPVFGSKKASQFLFVFADFQCPFCAQVRTALERFVVEHPDVSLVYKNYPLTQIHPEAMAAAQAAWAAQQQGKFWQFHDILFANQQAIGEELFLKAATELSLDIPRFNADRRSASASSSIQKDIEMADQLGISGTPFFLFNGNTFSGLVDESILQKNLSP